jgi:hypothetical protein
LLIDLSRAAGHPQSACNAQRLKGKIVPRRLVRATPCVSIPPEVLEQVRRPRRIGRSAGDRPMAEPLLDRACNVALAGEARHARSAAAGHSFHRQEWFADAPRRRGRPTRNIAVSPATKSSLRPSNRSNGTRQSALPVLTAAWWRTAFLRGDSGTRAVREKGSGPGAGDPGREACRQKLASKNFIAEDDCL